MIWVKLAEQPEPLREIAVQLSRLVAQLKDPRFPKVKPVIAEGTVHNVAESKLWLRELITTNKIISNQRGKWPVCANGNILSVKQSQRNGLYHLKKGEQQYRFENVRDLLSALRRDNTLEWAIFTNKSRRIWKRTASWVTVKHQDAAIKI